MNDVSQLLKLIGAQPALFPPNSRYKDTAVASIERNNGELVLYLKRRIVPKQEEFVVIEEHTVSDGERLDNITNYYLGDPEKFWQICDANGALCPDELTEIIGNPIKITLPAGISG